MFKSEVYQIVSQELEIRIQKLQILMEDVLDSGAGETKSSAGDKHETGRAMAQLEQEKISKQISELVQQRDVIRKIDPSTTHQKIQLGSLIETNKGWYFFSVGLGSIQLSNTKVFCISLQAPVAKLMFGKKIADCIHFNGQEIMVQKIQ
jgi:transcription elongation GreA/GreB family factor